MRKIPVLLLVLHLSTTTSSLAQTSTELEGVWERLYMHVVFQDTTIERTYEPGLRLTKILTSTHFAFGQQSQDGQNAFAGGGRYTLTESTYTEFVEYHSSSSLVGKAIPFDSRLEGDRWYISGVIGQFRLEETWLRLQ